MTAGVGVRRVRHRGFEAVPQLQVGREARRVQHVRVVRRGDDQRRAGEVEPVRGLVRREAPVHPDRDGADPRAGELDLDIGDAVARHQRHPVAPLHPAAEEDVGEPVHAGVQLRVGQASVALDQRVAPGPQRGGGREQPPHRRRRGLRDLGRRGVVPGFRRSCHRGPSRFPFSVMAGLVPAIHVSRHRGASREGTRRRPDVDARNKSGQDDRGVGLRRP